jgi:hypothetical protein
LDAITLAHIPVTVELVQSTAPAGGQSMVANQSYKLKAITLCSRYRDSLPGLLNLARFIAAAKS